MLPPDVIDFVLRRFGVEDRPEALRILANATIHDGSPAGPRLVRCAAVASAGALERLKEYVRLLQVDFRDVVMAGEYCGTGNKLAQVRDLSQPISSEA